MNVVAVHKNESGAWCVYVNGEFVSDHRTHDGARLAAQAHVDAERAAAVVDTGEAQKL